MDEVIAYIKSTGLSCSVGPFETTIEGDYDQLMDIVKECQHIIHWRGQHKTWNQLSDRQQLPQHQQGQYYSCGNAFTGDAL